MPFRGTRAKFDEDEEEMPSRARSILPGGMPDGPPQQRQTPPVDSTQPSPSQSGFRSKRASQRPPTTGERAEAVGQGAARGAITSAPLTMGTAGMLAGAPGGPATAALGGLSGLIVGLASERVANQYTNIPSIEEVPEELRPFQFGGEVVGASVGFGGMPFVRGAEQAGGKFVQRIIQNARSRPKSFAAAETSSVTGAAAAEGIAEGVDPGDTSTRILAGVAGGVLSPGALLFTFGRGTTNAIRNGVQGLSQAGRENRAAQELQRIVTEFGEDPAQLAKALREADMPGSGATAAQLTGSPALASMEAELIKRSAKFGAEAKQAAEESLSTIRGAIGALEEAGDPAALREAAKLRQQYFESLLTTRAAAAEAEAIDAVQKAGPETLDNVSDISRRVEQINSKALEQARKAERELWQKLPDEATLNADSTLARVRQIRQEEMLPEESLPELVQQFTERVARQADEGEPVTLREMRIFRSRMLDKARTADKNLEANEARIFGSVAEAVLDDMMKLDVPELADARAYSLALNDVFTRSFAGQAASTGKSGGARIPPEALMRRAMGSGQEMGALRLKEINRAVQFGSPEAGQELLGMQEQFLRNAATELVDEQTGLISPRRLATFRKRNKEILEQLPGLKPIFDDIATTRRFFDETVKSNKQATKAIEQRAAFSRVADEENTVRAVSRALEGPKPQESFRQLAVLARRDGEDAVAGLRRSVFDDAYARAGGDTESFSFDKFRRLLFEPRRAGGESVMSLMKRFNVMPKENEQRLRRLLDEADRIEEVMRTTSQSDEILEDSSAMFELITRATGAGLASQLSSAAPGAPGAGRSLIIAGAGSRYMQQVLDKVPRGRTQDILIEASKDKDFMATLLEKPASKGERIELANKLNAFLWQAGLVRGPEQTVEGDTPQQSRQQQLEQSLNIPD